MLAPLLLLAAGPTALAREPDAFQALLGEANRAWYELPKATASLRFSVGGEGQEASASSTVVRDGARFEYATASDGATVMVLRSDGKRTVALDYKARTYFVAPASPRPKWWDRKIRERPAPEGPSLQLYLVSDEGLTLEVPGEPLAITSEREGVRDGRRVRLVRAELSVLTDEGKRDRVVFDGAFDAAAKYLRDATVEVFPAGREVAEYRAVWKCRPEAARGFVFTTDLGRLSRWKRVEGLPPGPTGG